MLKPTIGLEIHIEAKTNSKMFCSCKNDPEEKEPNKNICPVCLGHPGALPTINRSAIEKIILAGLALNCKIKNYSRFDRKAIFILICQKDIKYLNLIFQYVKTDI